MPIKRSAAVHIPGPDSTTISSNDLKFKEMELDSGLIGKVFGGQKNAPNNIAGLALLSLLILLAVLIISSHPRSDYYADKLIPIISLTLGFLFGNKS